MKTNLPRIVAACCSTFLLGALPALAQDPASAPPPPPPTAAAPAPEATVSEVSAAELKAPSTHAFGIHTGVNVGLVQVDAMYDHFYGFASTTLGVPLLSNGDIAIGNVGLGYTTALSSPGESMWYFDIYGQGLAGKMNLSGIQGTPSGYGAIGLGVGIRYLHRSGFTVGFKLPVFGMSFGDAVSSGGSFSGPTSLGLYYLGNLFSSAPVTIGFRF
jgi:hypothetical protein